MFTPPLYGDIGKSSKDLFDCSKYGFKSIFSHGQKIGKVTVTTSGSAKDFSVEGCYKDKARKTKLKATSKKAIKFTDTENTLGGLPIKGTFEAEQAKSTKGKFSAEYTWEDFFTGFMAVSGSYDNGSKITDGKVEKPAMKASVEGSAVLGYAPWQLSCGFTAKADLMNMAVNDYGVGFQYSGLKNSVIALTSENSISAVKLSLFTKRTDTLSLATFGKYDTAGEHGFGFGVQKELSKCTLLKAKTAFGKENTGHVFLEHTLANPGVKVGVSASTKKLSFTFPPDLVTVGMGFTLGDI